MSFKVSFSGPLNSFSHKPHVSAEEVFEIAVGKGENACINQFLLFIMHFLLFWRIFRCIHQIKIVLCNHLQCAKVIVQFVVLERAKVPIVW